MIARPIEPAPTIATVRPRSERMTDHVSFFSHVNVRANRGNRRNDASSSATACSATSSE